MATESSKLKTSYAVVEVLQANRDGSGRFEIKNVLETEREASEEAAKLPGFTVALEFQPPNRRPNVGEAWAFQPGQDKDLDRAVREMNWQQESSKTVIVCRMDGRDGVPEVGMRVQYDMGRDHQGWAQERSAKLLGSAGLEPRTEENCYAAVERHAGIAREGTIIGVFPSRELAYERADERNRVIEQTMAALAPDALQKESFSHGQREIANQHLEERKRDQGMSMGM